MTRRRPNPLSRITTRLSKTLAAKFMKLYNFVALSALLLSFGPAHAAGDPATGETKATACAACHGMDGNSANPEWPSLAGQHPGYLATVDRLLGTDLET